MIQTYECNRYLGLSKHVVRTCKITMPHLNRLKSVHVRVMNVMIIDKQGHVTTIKSEENSEMYSQQAVHMHLTSINNAGYTCNKTPQVIKYTS